MPITITVPSEPFIGPGSFFLVSSDFIGPIPLDWTYQLQVYDDSEGLAWGAHVLSYGSHDVSGTLGVVLDGWVQENQDLFFPPEGAPVTVQVNLLNGSGGVEDYGTRSDLAWTTQGEFIRQLRSDALDTGALTPTQSAQLAAISPSITTAFLGTIGETILRGVGDLVLHPPVGFLVEDGDPLVLTGRGSLTRPAGPVAVNAFGVVLSYFTVPAGFGFRDGVVLEYVERIAQLATTHMLANGTREVLTEILDSHSDGYLWLWSRALPNRILYDVTPGCVVILRWLGATIPVS